jgi:hypothetical protein
LHIIIKNGITIVKKKGIYIVIIKTIRLSSVRLIGCILFTVIIAFTLSVFTPTSALSSAFSETYKTIYDNAHTNEGRIAFLKSFGWEVADKPIEITDVTVPSEFDSVFSNYNELQKLQGLDLSRYKQKQVTRYTYTVTNYQGYDGKVLASLIVYRGTVVGGDLCTEDASGFIHGFLRSTHL